MINITRDPAVPTALTTQEIRNYIDAAILHLADPAANPMPDKPAQYRSSDLLNAFDRCFFSKCYLTEQKFANSWPMDIEHFLGQAERPELVYEWTNLFPADHYTNMIKPRNTPVGGYMDPCDPVDDVENEIFYSLDIMGQKPQFQARNNANIKAVNTSNLLNRVHNGHDEKSIKTTETLRHAIHKKYIEILNKLVEYHRNADGSNEKHQAERELKDMLSRQSSFTMLCRSMPAVRGLPADFFD